MCKIDVYIHNYVAAKIDRPSTLQPMAFIRSTLIDLNVPNNPHLQLLNQVE